MSRWPEMEVLNKLPQLSEIMILVCPSCKQEYKYRDYDLQYWEEPHCYKNGCTKKLVEILLWIP